MPGFASPTVRHQTRGAVRHARSQITSGSAAYEPGSDPHRARGTIVGEARQAPDPNPTFPDYGLLYDEAFVYTGGTIAALGANDATKVNNRGQVAGYNYSLPWKGNPGSTTGFLETDGQFLQLYTRPGFASDWMTASPLSLPTGINDLGQVVGYANAVDGSTPAHAVLYHGAVPQDLGTLIGPRGNSGATAINNAGLIVGGSNISLGTGGVPGHGFLFADGQMIDLNDALPAGSGWTITSASDVNNRGQIVGQGINSRGQTHAVLLTPVLASISGTVFNDRNGDGVRQTAREAGLGGFRVYADLNHNNKYDAGEPASITDAAGRYALSGLDAGGYALRVAPRAGYALTNPYPPETVVAAGMAVTGPSFGAATVGPFHGAPTLLPGRVQAEDYDFGGEGVSYHDSEALNRGGFYRPGEGADTGAIPTASGGGTFLGWTHAGEWVNYTVAVGTAGNYALNFRVASLGAGGSFHVSIDGVNVLSKVAIPNTGGWDTYTTVKGGTIHLSTGTHVVRLTFDANGPAGVAGNIDWFDAVKR